MSSIVRFQSNGECRNIYFIYNFKQVDNLVIIVVYNSCNKRWEKFNVHYSDGQWEIDAIESIDEKTMFEIRRKLEIIFDQQQDPRHVHAIETDAAIEKEAEFLLQLDS